MLVKQLHNFRPVFLQNQCSLRVKCILYSCKLVTIVQTHILKLLFHCLYEFIDIVILFFESLNVFFVLHFELLHKHLDQFFLLSDYLETCLFLDINVLHSLTLIRVTVITLANSSQSSFSSSSYHCQSISTVFL
jgi:hypothetical protein